VVTYAEDGQYGHPDHMKAHYVTASALDMLQREGWSPLKVYYTAIPRSMMEEFAKQFPDQAERSAAQNMRVIGTPDELITTRIDVHDYVDQKRKAFEAHVSQNDPDSWFASMASQLLELALGTEYYQLVRGKPGAELPETDLFAGIR
jgi:N-acetyl-1-D-myo-inositol-2-amino-2-deoxy-alpha-D-glucopyranoside deacetylase